MRVNITEGVQGLGPEGAKDEAKSGLQGRLKGSRSLIFSLRPKRIRGRGRARGRARLGASERLRGRRNGRSSTRFSSKSLSRTSFSFFNRNRPRPLVLPDRREFR